jgi:stage II sporulation protein M
MNKKTRKKPEKTSLKRPSIKAKSETIIGKYSGLWGFIKESKKFFYTIIGVFLVTLAIGFAFPHFFAEIFQEMIRDLIAKTKDLGFSEMFAFIIYNNIKTSFLGFIFGLIFGIFPLFLAALNGYLLGFVTRLVYSENGLGDLWRILPHGIFELPAFFLSLGLGVQLGYTLFLRTKDFKRVLKSSLETFIYIVIPLLLLAGIIETGLIFLLK